jgi:hypothetical protein
LTARFAKFESCRRCNLSSPWSARPRGMRERRTIKR